MSRIQSTSGGGGTSVELSDDAAEPLGVAASGNSEEGSRANHVHAHGDLAGGTLHAEVGADPGFMTPALVTELEAATSDIAGLDTRVGSAESALTSLDGRLDTAESDISTLESVDSSLDSRLDTAESDIDNLQSADTSLDGRLDTAEGEIDALQSADTSLDGRIDVLEAASHADEVDAADGVSGIVNTTTQTMGDGPKIFKNTVTVGEVSAPSAPSTGIKIYSSIDHNRPTLMAKFPGEIEQAIQESFAHNVVMYCAAQHQGSPVHQFGLTLANFNAGPTAGGAAALTNRYTQLPVVNWTSTAPANSTGGFSSNVSEHMWRGNASGQGGFYLSMRFGFTDIPATRRWSAGFKANGTTPSAEPSSASNLHWFGVGQDTSDTTIFFMHNDGTLTATRTNTTLASPVAQTDILELVIWCLPNDSVMYMSIQKLGSGVAPIKYNANTNLPLNSDFGRCFVYANNSSTAAAITVALNRIYIKAEW